MNKLPSVPARDVADPCHPTLAVLTEADSLALAVLKAAGTSLFCG